MDKINLEEGKIYHEGKWLSVEDLSRTIQEKMQAGEMKFSALAVALEKLKTALENSHLISVKLSITREEYNRLKALGQEDDRECIRKAIRKFIGEEKSSNKNGRKISKIKCAGCRSLISVDSDRRGGEIVCPECGARGVLKMSNQGRSI
jgi:DNA-directed RNA polymerase subunit RPC12/RpoP